MNTRIVLAVLAIGLVVACRSTATDVELFGEYPARAVDSTVTVWLDGNPPADVVVAAGPESYRGNGPKDHIVIAQLNVRKGAAESWETTINRMKVESRKIGGQGIVVRWRSGYTITAPRVAVTVFRRASTAEK